MEIWQSRRFRYLLNLIEHLPRNSYFVESFADDDELAEARADDTEQRDERLSEWSPEREILANVSDQLTLIAALLTVANGHPPPRSDPYPRPITALDRVRVKGYRSQHERLVARLLARPE